MKLRPGYNWLLLSILIAPSILALAVFASPSAPSWLSLSSGRGDIASGSHQLMASFAQGQPVGVSSSQSFGLQAGFWPGAGAPTPNKWDLNGDGTVDGTDLRVVAANLGASGGIADLNGDGLVDVLGNL